VLCGALGYSSKGGFVSTHGSLELLDKLLALWLIVDYLLLEIFPGLRAVLVGSSYYLMDGMVDLLSIAGIDHNASLVEDFL
jgi:hypothetical protein